MIGNEVNLRLIRVVPHQTRLIETDEEETIGIPRTRMHREEVVHHGLSSKMLGQECKAAVQVQAEAVVHPETHVHCVTEYISPLIATSTKLWTKESKQFKHVLFVTLA